MVSLIQYLYYIDERFLISILIPLGLRSLDPGANPSPVLSWSYSIGRPPNHTLMV